MSRILKIRIVFFVSIILIFYFSLVNAEDIPRFDALSFLSDKALHTLIFFYLAYLGLISKFELGDYQIISLVFLIGAIIELIHYFHPYRYFELFDLLANLIGVTIALLIFRLKKVI